MFTNAFLLIISTVVLFLTSCPVQFSLTLTNYLLLSIHNCVKFNWHNIPLKSGKSKCARRIGSILIWNLITETVFLHLRLTQMWIFFLYRREQLKRSINGDITDSKEKSTSPIHFFSSNFLCSKSKQKLKKKKSASNAPFSDGNYPLYSSSATGEFGV